MSLFISKDIKIVDQFPPLIFEVAIVKLHFGAFSLFFGWFPQFKQQDVCIHNFGRWRLEKRGPTHTERTPVKIASVLLYDKMHDICLLALGESQIRNLGHLPPH